MATINSSNINITDLDFDNVSNSLKEYLKGQSTLKDYDFDFMKLWNDKKATETRKWIKDTKCKCSFECALAANVVWKPKNYPKVVSSAIKNIGKSHINH